MKCTRNQRETVNNGLSFSTRLHLVLHVEWCHCNGGAAPTLPQRAQPLDARNARQDVLEINWMGNTDPSIKTPPRSFSVTVSVAGAVETVHLLNSASTFDFILYCERSLCTRFVVHAVPQWSLTYSKITNEQKNSTPRSQLKSTIVHTFALFIVDYH